MNTVDFSMDSDSAGGESPRTNATFLIIILDIFDKKMRENADSFAKCVDAVLSFCTMYFTDHLQNELALMFLHNQAMGFLYPASASHLDDTPIEGEGVFPKVSPTVKKAMLAMLANESEQPVSKYLHAAAITKALCYVQRMKREKPVHKYLRSRILLVTYSGGYPPDMLFQPIFLMAKKLGVVLDVCSIFNHLSGLQHGCDLTGGLYACLPNMEKFFQRLNAIFLHDLIEIKIKPSLLFVNAAACVCHLKFINSGFVCYSCLSLFCEPQSICSTCGYVLPLSLQNLRLSKIH